MSGPLHHAARIFGVILGLVLALSSVHARQPANELVEYTVSIPEPQTQTLSIAMTLREVTEPSIEVSLPVWRPGRYAIVDPASTIRTVSARSGKGVPLPIVKIEKSTWIVKSAAADGDRLVTIEYSLYANSLGDRTRHVDDTHAFLSPASVFMYSESRRSQPVRVRLEAPAGWRVATGLDPESDDPRVLRAANYDILVDSPIEMGRQEVLPFDVDGTPHEMVFWTGAGPLPAFDHERMTRDVASIIRNQRDIFGGFPYKRYVFIVHCYAGGGGATEHLNSTVMQCPPSRLSTPEAARGFCGLVAHEYFHTYNVKQLRPAGLKPYDYLHENYTELLWVAEGVTTYYADVTRVRVALIKPDEYFKSLGDSIDAYRRRPGAAVQSVEDSSYDAWIKFSRPSPDAVNSTVSFYDKGALAAVVLDLELRKLSKGKVGLDQVMSELYRLFPLEGPGYTTEDLLRACERLSGESVRSLYVDAIHGTKPLDFESSLALAGLEVVNDAAKVEGSDVPKQRAFIGVNVEARDGAAAVSSVLSTGPAYRAGVIAGDVIVAINGHRVRGTDLDTHLKQIKPGETTRLTLFRYDLLREVEFKADGQDDGKWVVRRIKSPTPEQRAMYESWLGVKWPEEVK